MIDEMELADEIYAKLIKNNEFLGLIGNPKTAADRNKRIRREICPVDYATVENVNFICIYLTSATETENIWVTRGFLNVDYYTKNREDCRKMKRIVMDILNDMDMHCVSMYNEESDTKGIFKYTQRYRPLLWS